LKKWVTSADDSSIFKQSSTRTCISMTKPITGKAAICLSIYLDCCCYLGDEMYELLKGLSRLDRR
jgi:hypothetical protein